MNLVVIPDRVACWNSGLTCCLREISVVWDFPGRSLNDFPVHVLVSSLYSFPQWTKTIHAKSTGNFILSQDVSGRGQGRS